MGTGVNAYNVRTDVADIEKIISMPVREAIGRYKYTSESEIDKKYEDVESVETYLEDSKIKMLKLNDYSFASRIHNKLISD